MESRNRGIAFRFTFERWVAWWEKHLGPDRLSLRGTKSHQYVMARKGDKGSYCVANVECITASKNMTDANHNNPHGNGGATRGYKHTLEHKRMLSRMRRGKTIHSTAEFTQLKRAQK